MTYRAEDDPYDAESETYAVEEEEPEKRGALSWILIIALLVGAGCGSALAWRSYGGAMVSQAMSASPASAGKQISQADVEALQQQIADSVQSTEKLLATQQAEIKRLTDQVTALTGKLDLLQRPVTSAQAAIPAQAPPRTPAAAKPVAAKPEAAKPAAQGGPISTGGAPLQPKP